MHGEKARWELHKNATSAFEQILEAAPYETAVVRPLVSHLSNHTSKTNKTYWRSREELSNDVLLWTSTHGHTSIDYIYINIEGSFNLHS